MFVNLTEHARVRAAQRNFSEDDIYFIINHGQSVHRAGAVFFQLLHKCIPNDIPANHRYRQLMGATVLMCPSCGQVKTVYKNCKSFKKDRAKSKYDFREGNCGCESDHIH